VVVFLVDGSRRPSAEDRMIAELLRKHRRGPVILAVNKIDLLSPTQVEQAAAPYRALGDFDAWIALSATRGDNREELLNMIISFLPPGPRYYPEDQITDQPMRVIAAEMIREQVLHFTRHEVPHAVAVVVDEFKERSEDLTYIHATIIVERPTQKQIIIGEGGKMLKKIGQAARQEIERLVGTRVYLELWVKVWKKWRKREAELRRLGYAIPRR